VRVGMGEGERRGVACAVDARRPVPTPAPPRGTHVDDTRFMRRALDLAERGWGAASPNPMVGAVLVLEGQIVGEGWYGGPGAGHPHAEVHALRAAGQRARGATLYSTLEPCDHHGRTPPCTRAILEAGVARVVIAARDPNPLVDGRGIERLSSAGVDVVTGPFADEARRLNEAFERHVVSGRPFVTLKMAASLDGKVAARDGTSRWISGEASRADAHRLRAWADAIVVGAGTVLADDPSLTVRDARYVGPPVPRVVVDAAGRVPVTARIFDAQAPTIVATTDRAPSDRRDAWREAGADVLVLDEVDGGVSVEALFATLGKRDVQGLLLEGGPSLAWSAVAAACVDKIVLYLAPILVGGTEAPGMLEGDGFAPLRAARALDIRGVSRLDGDVRVEAYVHRDR
jgi:diaminohydroxyphosphoribosylaminopyrimidine deaminase / 5-amino-6-(5-phosphoribosylamino)uracil reductase